MIDNLIYDPKNKFGLIWSYILKVMNFIILRDSKPSVSLSH